MYKHAMLTQLKNYGMVKRMQPVLARQIDGAKWRLEKHGDRLTPEGLTRSRMLERMQRTYRENREFLADIDCCMQVLDDREKTVIHHFYLERTWDYMDILSDKLGVERSQIYRIKDRAMKKLVQTYYGV